jgi:hypothetical protein
MEYQSRMYDPSSGREVTSRDVRQPFTAATYQPSDHGIDDPDVAHSGPVSVLDVHDPRATPAPTVDPAASADIGGLGKGDYPFDDGIESIDNIGEGTSGTRPDLALPGRR